MSKARTYRHENGLCSTIAESADDWNTTTFGSYEYDAYGVPYTLKTGYFTSRFRFAGKSGCYTDSDTGLVLCGARFYLPALGRFLTQDPIGQSGGLNLYEYCGDNPINKLDPSGRSWNWRQYFSDVGGVLRGYGQAGLGVITGPYHAAQFLGAWAGNDWSGSYLGKSASAAWGGFYGGLTGERGPEGFGDSFGSVLIAAGTAGAGFAEGGAFSKMAYVTRWDTVEALQAIEDAGYLKAGAFVQRGRGGAFGYMASGVYQPDLAYPFASKMSILISKGSLGVPAGALGKVKWLMGQRVLTRDFHF